MTDMYFIFLLNYFSRVFCYGCVFVPHLFTRKIQEKSINVFEKSTRSPKARNIASRELLRRRAIFTANNLLCESRAAPEF